MSDRYLLKNQINNIPYETFPVVWNDDHYHLYQNLALIVFNYHFSAYHNIQEDLIQGAITKIYFLIIDGNYNRKYPFFNFLYTGCRNSMTNFIYHDRKLVCVSEDVIDLSFINLDYYSYNDFRISDDKNFSDRNYPHTLWKIFKGYSMVNVFDFDSPEERDLFIALISDRMKLDFSSFIDNNTQDVLLAVLHFFTGHLLRVPSEDLSNGYRLKAKAFKLYLDGRSVSEISKIMSLSVSKIKLYLKHSLKSIDDCELNDIPDYYSQCDSSY